MVKLLTRNPKKYQLFHQRLDEIGIGIEISSIIVPEIQEVEFKAAVSSKAFFVYQNLGPGYLVDDSGIYLDAYPGFPGTITSVILKQLGYKGMQRLMRGVEHSARMVCYIGTWVDDSLWYWTGEALGSFVPLEQPTDSQVPLSDWFVPDEKTEYGVFLHRKRALDALAADIEKLNSALAL